VHALQGFDGDTDLFVDIKPALTHCLIAHGAEEAKPKKPPYLAFAACAILAGVVTYFAHQSWELQKLTQQTLATINSEPGYVVTQVEEREKQLLVRGLRDPFARKISELIPLATQQQLNMQIDLHPWQSLDQSMITKRVQMALQDLPSTVNYEYTNHKLVLTGSMHINRAERVLPVVTGIAGVDTIDTASLTIDKPAPPPPIAAALPPRPDLAALGTTLEQQRIYFNSGASEPDSESLQRLPMLAKALSDLVHVARSQNLDTDIAVVGYSDRSGSARINQQVSEQRAKTVTLILDEFDKADIAYRLEARGRVTESMENTMQQLGQNTRHVRLRISYTPMTTPEKQP